MQLQFLPGLQRCWPSLGGVGGSLKAGRRLGLCWDTPVLSVHLSMCLPSTLATVRGTLQFPSCGTGRGIGSASWEFCSS